MPECAGLWGRLFGHKMERFTTKRTAPNQATVASIMSTTMYNHPCDDKTDLLEYASCFDYVARCARCGMEPK